MRSSLNQEQREQITVAELARLVFRLAKGIEQDMKKQAEVRTSKFRSTYLQEYRFQHIGQF